MILKAGINGRKEIKRELILDNHSEVMYDYSLITEKEIRNDDNAK